MSQSERILGLALGGSRIMNLAQFRSDFDYYALYAENCGTNVIHSIPCTQNDLCLTSLEEITEEWEKWIGQERIYPTIWTRSDNFFSGDDARKVVYNIFLSGAGWINPEMTLEEFAVVRQVLNVKDICDFHYTRAFCNYRDSIKGASAVIIKKYLYTVWELLYCSCLIEQKSCKVPYGFSVLLESSKFAKSDMQMCNQIQTVLSANKSAEKLEKIAVQPAINDWIRIQLENIGDAISKCDNQIVYPSYNTRGGGYSKTLYAFFIFFRRRKEI